MRIKTQFKKLATRAYRFLRSRCFFLSRIRFFLVFQRNFVIFIFQTREPRFIV